MIAIKGIILHIFGVQGVGVEVFGFEGLGLELEGPVCPKDSYPLNPQP